MAQRQARVSARSAHGGQGAGSSGRRRKTVSSRGRSVMSPAVSSDIASMRSEVDDMIASLEQRLGHLKQVARRGASHVSEDANDMMFNAISGFTGQMADRVQSNAQAVSNEMSRMGNSAMKRVAKEIDQHPLLTLAIAAGIGFIAGLARRPE